MFRRSVSRERKTPIKHAELCLKIKVLRDVLVPLRSAEGYGSYQKAPTSPYPVPHAQAAGHEVAPCSYSLHPILPGVPPAPCRPRAFCPSGSVSPARRSCSLYPLGLYGGRCSFSARSAHSKKYPDRSIGFNRPENSAGPAWHPSANHEKLEEPTSKCPCYAVVG